MWGKKSVAQPPIDPKLLDLIARYSQSAEERVAAMRGQVLFFGNDWGLPVEQVPKAVAKEHNLVMFSGKWVTPEESKVLEKESRSYKVIRSMGGALIVGGLLYAGVGMLVLYDDIGKGADLFGTVVLLGIAGVICGAGLLGLKQWAAYAASLILAAGVVVPPVIVITADKASPAVMDPLAKSIAPVLLGLLMCINFYLPTGRKIFRAGRQKRRRAVDCF